MSPDEAVFKNIQDIVQDYWDEALKEGLKGLITLVVAYFLALAAPNIVRLAELVFKDDKEG